LFLGFLIFENEMFVDVAVFFLHDDRHDDSLDLLCLH